MILELHAAELQLGCQVDAINRLVGQKTNKAVGSRNKTEWKRQICPAPTAENKTASNKQLHLELNPSQPLSLGHRLFPQRTWTSCMFPVHSHNNTCHWDTQRHSSQIMDWCSFVAPALWIHFSEIFGHHSKLRAPQLSALVVCSHSHTKIKSEKNPEFVVS